MTIARKRGPFPIYIFYASCVIELWCQLLTNKKARAYSYIYLLCFMRISTVVSINDDCKKAWASSNIYILCFMRHSTLVSINDDNKKGWASSNTIPLRSILVSTYILHVVSINLVQTSTTIANFSFRVFYLIEQWKNAYTLYSKYMYVQDHHGDLQLIYCALF